MTHRHKKTLKGDTSKINVAVTGGDGFLGNVITRKLLTLGYAVRILLFQKKSHQNHSDAVEYIWGDIRNQDDVNAFCEGMDIVIHAASLISIVRHRDEEMEVCNVQGTKNVIEACKLHQVSKLVYISSVEAIGNLNKDIHTEEDGFNEHHSLISYGAKKARASKSVLAFSKEYKDTHNCNVNIICPSGIIGPFDRGTSDTGNMVQKFLHRKLYAYPASGGFCFVDVRDVAEVAIRSMTKDNNGEIYIATGEYSSVAHLMNTLEQISGVKKPKLKLSLWFLYIVGFFVEHISKHTKAKAVITTGSVNILKSCMKVSSEKMERELGIIPRSISASLQDQIAWYYKEEIRLD